MGSWQAAYAALQRFEVREAYARCVLGEPAGQLDPRAVKWLLQAGLLIEQAGAVRLDDEHFEANLAAAARSRPQGPDRYLQIGKLEVLPQQAAEREALLRRVRDRLFEHSRSYSESEVNCLLRVITDDVSGIRRALVDGLLLDRERDGAVYWIREPAS